MNSTSYMLIAGDPSGDALAAELVGALKRRHAGGTAPVFFGAGGPKLAAAGVALEFDLTRHAVIGMWEVLKKLVDFRRLFRHLLAVALERRPDVIMCVDFSGFNRRFAHAVRREIARRGIAWRPRIVQYVSPQVWASRPGRAAKMARDIDLLLSILPFEKDWYAARVPELKVEFVGHPIVERHAGVDFRKHHSAPDAPPLVTLLSGSRPGEIKRHWPVLVAAWAKIRSEVPQAKAVAVFPNDALRALATSLAQPDASASLQLGGLDSALATSSVALAATGTVTLECALFRVPTVAFYKTSWLTYQIARRIVTVNSLTMPNLLAGERVFPEFVQDDANAANLAGAALEFLRTPASADEVRRKLDAVVASLGTPGASERAAAAIDALLPRLPGTAQGS
jgi:lipid-A-disaccharide synthase